MLNPLFTALAAFAAVLLILAVLLLIPGCSYPVVALAKLSQAPAGTVHWHTLLTHWSPLRMS